MRRTLVETAYVLVVAVTAVVGFATDSTAAILLAAALALPSSVVAVVAYYLVYGLLALVPGANPDSGSGEASCNADGACRSSTTGDLATWFALTADVLGIVALSAAAVVNVLVLRRVSGRW